MTTFAGQWGPEAITGRGGSPLPNDPITVFQSDGHTLATIYSDRTKATQIANPTATDVNGNLSIFAAPGQYVISNGVLTLNITVPIDPADVGGATAGVASFNSRTGAVVPLNGDYSVGQVTGAAPLASPALTGTPTAVTGSPGDNSTQIATDAFVQAALAGFSSNGWNVVAKSANYVASNRDLVLATAGSNGFTVTLPAPALDTMVIAKKVDSGAGTVTIQHHGSETIDGVTSLGLIIQNDAVWLASDGTNWFIVDPVIANANVQSIVQTSAWQNVPRRGGNIGAATAIDTSAAYPYGQVEVAIGDSIATGFGASTTARSWYMLLSQWENRRLGLADPHPQGLLQANSFAAVGASLTPVQGLGINSSDISGVLLSGTVGSSTAANSLTDTNTFSRAIIFYIPLANSDGIGISIAGQGGALLHTIDGTGIATGGNSNVAFYDTGVVSPTATTALSLTRQTHVTGSGGTSPAILAVRYYGVGVTGASGLSTESIAAGGLTSADWVINRGWENYLGAISAQIRRIHIRLGGNDIILARSVSDASFNNSNILNSASASFHTGDVGRPVTGNANIPAGTVISQYLSATQVQLSAATTGGSFSSQTVTFGQIPPATTAANLALVIQRARAQCPHAEIALFGEYQPYATVLDPAGMMTPTVYANTIVPMYQLVAFNNNATYVDMFSRFGSVSHRQFNDCTINNSSPTITSTALAQFCPGDTGAKITGTNIPAGTTLQTYISPTQFTMSANATGSASGQYLINNDIYQLTFDNGLHFGDATNNNPGYVDGQRAHAAEIWERLGYAQDWPQAPVALQTIASTGTWVCPVTGTYLVTCVGGGGGGGGGSTPNSTIDQAGSGGGGQGEVKQQVMNLTAGTAYACTVGGGGGGGPAGLAGGHAGTQGSAGGNTTFAGSSTLVAAGGAGGTSATASSGTAGGFGGIYGGSVIQAAAATQSAYAAAYPLAGNGGYGAQPGNFLVAGGTGGAAIGIGAGGGGGSGRSTGGTGGGGGAAGSLNAASGGAGGASAGGSGANGAAGGNGGAFQWGAGGGAGGPAGTNAGTAGVGGNGANGVIYLQKVG